MAINLPPVPPAIIESEASIDVSNIAVGQDWQGSGTSGGRERDEVKEHT